MSDFPIHSSRMTIPWSVAEQAFLGYEKKYGKGQSLETIAKRGGFGVEELDEFHPEWREHIELKALAASRKELLRKVLKAYHEGIGSPLKFDEWIRAMDRGYGWKLVEELGDE